MELTSYPTTSDVQWGYTLPADVQIIDLTLTDRTVAEYYVLERTPAYWFSEIYIVECLR